MILFEITDEAGMTYYEVLGISLEELVGQDNTAIGKKIREAANKARTPYESGKNREDSVAKEKIKLIHKALATLQDRKKREKYNEELESGKSVRLAILQVRSIAPPFFSDRNARFRTIERLMREAGLNEPGQAR